jgi:hypothetical protein
MKGKIVVGLKKIKQVRRNTTPDVTDESSRVPEELREYTCHTPAQER